MTKKHFIALADAIRFHNKLVADKVINSPAFTVGQLDILAGACEEQNPQFNRERWLSYVAGECGPNGGRIK
jgi:hypothetical protein